MHRAAACAGVAALVGSIGCAPLGAANGEGAATAGLAFEVPADVTDACTPSGRTRILATGVAESEPVLARAHEGWLSLTFTSLERGRTTLDLELGTLNVLVARSTSLAAPDVGSLSAINENGHGVQAWLIPGPRGTVIAAAPLECAHR